ncbi:MAG: bZIP transcription factor, partial [Candidatus Competibacteraceae bacterium]|nr:bZIP transcription factor [Candidatus Competibacteraceae bacterium]
MTTIKAFLLPWVLGVMLLLVASVPPAQAEETNACISKWGSIRLVSEPEQCKRLWEKAVSWTDGAELQDQIDTLTDQVATLETENTALADQIDDLEATNTTLTENLACLASESDDQNLYFVGCNVHVQNGEGATDTTNGVGNLIVGYDEADSGSDHCSNGEYADEASCE